VSERSSPACSHKLTQSTLSSCSATEESSWDAPEEGFNPPPPSESSDADVGEVGTDEPQESAAAASAEGGDGAAVDSGWVAYTDDEGREYFFNTETNETQWDRPDGYRTPPPSALAAAQPEDGEEPEENFTGEPMVTEDPADSEDERETMETEAGEDAARATVFDEPEPDDVDPAVQRVMDAERALARTDSVLEPDCMEHVTELVTSEGGNPQRAIAALIDSYHGQTAICGLLARWLAGVQQPPPSQQHQHQQQMGDGAIASAASAASNGDPTEAAADRIRQVAQDVVCKIAKERFSKETGDSILNLSKVKAAFLEEMMDSPRWRKLLIDLSADHKDSAVLVYCLRAISKRGHHREIARRVNQSEHFPVFNAMLLSELAAVGGVAVSAGSDPAVAVGLEELVNDLRRACSSTSYTYLYSIELLRYLDDKVRRQIGPSDRLARVRRKWEALAQSLESEMMDPSSSSYASVTSPLFRRRRLEVALTISELHQRQRKRRRYEDRIEPVHGPDRLESPLETALLDFLRRHATGIQVDDVVVDRLLPQGLDLTTSAITGRLLIEHPLAIRALLGHLYKPGAARLTAPVVRNKCARLVAIGVLAAEIAALEELLEQEEEEGEAASSDSDEVALTRMILEGSQLCEQLESMVSFLVTTGDEKSSSSTSSPGRKLCSLALQNAAVAQGVMIWAREFTRGSEFAASASFPTLSVSILSLVRIVCVSQPFTRRVALDIALAFLKHSNPDISYQKVSAIKEQSLRLLIFLIIKGEVVPVFAAITSRLQDSTSSDLDASLIRYFMGGVLEVVQPPVSLVFVRSFAALLQCPRCLDAVRSSYFGDPHKSRLIRLLQSFGQVRANTEGKPPGPSDLALINSLNALL
jgi:TH1 protein/WW domain